MKKLVYLLVIFLIPLNVFADPIYDFDEETGTLTISGTGAAGRGGIDKQKIKNVIIKEGITSVEGSAFREASNLTSVTLPESLTSIGSWAFHATNLGSVNIPKNVTTISSMAFYHANLTSVQFAEGSKLQTIGQEAFETNWFTSVNIPDSVQTISNAAFNGACFYVTDVTASAENLEKYLQAAGKFSSNATLHCTVGDCAAVLAAWDSEHNTSYATNVSVSYVPIEVPSDDGSVRIYKNGKLVGFKKKRIYTVDEAEKLSKKTGNKFRIRYK